MYIFIDIIQGIVKGLISGDKKSRWLVFIAIGFTLTAIIVVAGSELAKTGADFSKIAAAILAIFGAVLGLGVQVYEETKVKKKAEQKIEHLEKEVNEKPAEAKTAWELARLKLESYLNKNLQQVSAIFYLSATIMIVGFALIVFGIYKVFVNPDFMSASILTTCSGIIINLIGGTFLLIYKSTMEQARSYVDVLERINAVGMSLQILDNISPNNPSLRDETTAAIAKELLKIYGDSKNKERKKNPKR